jgi:hypothetical protein
MDFDGIPPQIQSYPSAELWVGAKTSNNIYGVPSKLVVLTGSGTYTPTAGTKSLWVRLVGAGGGGSGGNGGATATAGGSTVFDSTGTSVTGNGGNPGTNGPAPGAGGTAVNGDLNITGNSGSNTDFVAGQAGLPGGVSHLTGYGDGGYGGNGGSSTPGGPAGAGGYSEKVYLNPVGPYTYGCGTGGPGTAGGAGAGAGLAGKNGVIFVMEFS